MSTFQSAIGFLDYCHLADPTVEAVGDTSVPSSNEQSLNDPNLDVPVEFEEISTFDGEISLGIRWENTKNLPSLDGEFPGNLTYWMDFISILGLRIIEGGENTTEIEYQIIAYVEDDYTSESFTTPFIGARHTGRDRRFHVHYVFDAPVEFRSIRINLRVKDHAGGSSNISVGHVFPGRLWRPFNTHIPDLVYNRIRLADSTVSPAGLIRKNRKYTRRSVGITYENLNREEVIGFKYNQAPGDNEYVFKPDYLTSIDDIEDWSSLDSPVVFFPNINFELHPGENSGMGQDWTLSLYGLLDDGTTGARRVRNVPEADYHPEDPYGDYIAAEGFWSKTFQIREL